MNSMANDTTGKTRKHVAKSKETISTADYPKYLRSEHGQAAKKGARAPTRKKELSFEERFAAEIAKTRAEVEEAYQAFPDIVVPPE